MGADHKLFVLTLQYNGRFAGSERRAPLYRIPLTLKRHLQTRTKLAQPLVVLLRIDLFHRLVSYHIGLKSLNCRQIDITTPQE